MDTLGDSVISCAVRLETLGEDPSEKQCCFCLLVLIQRCLKKETALTLGPCAHKFRFTCISQWINKSPGCPLDQRLHLGLSEPVAPRFDKKLPGVSREKSLANSGTKVIFVTQWALNCCFVRDTEKL